MQYLQLVPQRQHLQLQRSARACTASQGQQERQEDGHLAKKRTPWPSARSTVATGTDFSVDTACALTRDPVLELLAARQLRLSQADRVLWVWSCQSL